MALEKQERIIIPDEDGEEHLFEVLFTFDVDETGHSYITVIPVESVEDEEVDVYAFRYEVQDENDNDFALYPIESDEEWDIVEEMIETLAEEDELN